MTDECVSTKHGWNDTDGKTEVLGEKNLSQCCFVHHKSDVDWPEIGPGLCGWKLVTDCQRYGMAWHGSIHLQQCVVSSNNCIAGISHCAWDFCMMHVGIKLQLGLSEVLILYLNL